MIKINKSSFDKYAPDLFKRLTKQFLGSLRLCQLFLKTDDDILMNLAMRLVSKTFNNDDIILGKNRKTESIYIIINGNVKVNRSFNIK